MRLSLLLALFCALHAGPVQADESTCPRLQGLDENAKVNQYCENFTPYNKTAEVMKAQQSCQRFYLSVIHIVKHVCNYLDEVDKFNAGDLTLVAALDKARGQAASDSTASVVNSRARALSRKWWIKTMGDLHALDPIYREYMEVRLATLTRSSVDILREEVMGTSCGRREAPLSLNLLGLGGLSTDEARNTYEKIGPALAKLSDRLMRNSNNFENTADQLKGLVERASSITGLPEAGGQSVAGAVAGDTASRNAEQGVAASRAANAAHPREEGMLRLVSGRLVPRPSAGATGAIGLFVDVGLTWIQHRPLDSTTGVFIALRAFVAGAGAAGVLGGGVVVSSVIEVALGWIEGMARAGQDAEFQARLRSYLPFVKKIAQPDSLSTTVSRQWHAETRADFGEVDPVSGQWRNRPLGMVTEYCR